MSASPSLFEAGLLRRLQQGRLRFDGVTAFQRRVLTVMHARRWVTLDAGGFWALTPTAPI